MGFRKAPKAFFPLFFPVLPILYPGKNSQIIFVHLPLGIIIIFPNKAAVFPVFCNRGIPDNRFVFINRIEIENKEPARAQIIIHQSECLQNILFLQKIIQGVAHAHHGSYAPIQFQFPHILHQIQDFLPRTFLFPLGNIQHFLGIVNPNHIIALIRQKLSQRSRSAAQIHHHIALCSQSFPVHPLFFR